MYEVRLTRPEHPKNPKAILATLREIVQNDRWTEGEYSRNLEQVVAQTSGSLYAVAVPSANSAMGCIFSNMKLQHDDEVILPSYISMGTVHALLAQGARPVFADVHPKNFALDYEDVVSKISDKTRAVVLAHMFGIPADGFRFRDLCREQNFFLIEDAGIGLGSQYESKAVGTFGYAGILDFHPRKILQVGEGGMVLTDRKSLTDCLRVQGGQGRAEKNSGQHGPLHGSATVNQHGQNYRMSEFQAALGLWAMDHLEEAIQRRRELAQYYYEAFSDRKEVAMTLEPARGVWNYQAFPIRVPGAKRELVMAKLHQSGIETHCGVSPAHMHPYIQAMLQPPRLPNTEKASHELLLLPLHTSMTTPHLERVIEALKNAL